MKRQFFLKWRLGCRTAGLISMTAKRFQSRVLISDGQVTADARDIMGLILLGAAQDTIVDMALRTWGPKAGSKLTVAVDGPDADRALAAFTELFTVGRRELVCPFQPCSSTPILALYTPIDVWYACSNYHEWTVPRAPTAAPR